MLGRDTESLKNVILYVILLQVICEIKLCFQLNTHDLTWRVFFKAARKNVKTRFLLQDFLSLSR